MINKIVKNVITINITVLNAMKIKFWIKLKEINNVNKLVILVYRFMTLIKA